MHKHDNINKCISPISLNFHLIIMDINNRYSRVLDTFNTCTNLDSIENDVSWKFCKDDG